MCIVPNIQNDDGQAPIHYASFPAAFYGNFNDGKATAYENCDTVLRGNYSKQEYVYEKSCFIHLFVVVFYCVLFQMF